MVTSVSRENAELAGRSLSLGAADYVEKPTLANVAERGEEIRNKLRCSVQMKSVAAKPNLSLDKQFQKKVRIDRPESKLRLVILPLSSRAKLKNLFQETPGVQPATLLFVEGSKEAIPALAETLSKETGQKIVGATEIPTTLLPNQIYLMDLGSALPQVALAHSKSKKASILVYGDLSKGSADKILQYSGAHLLLEDLGSGRGAKALQDIASDTVPHTSFGYMSCEYFSKP
jgi:chemotaxis protein methyltransferase CheR